MFNFTGSYSISSPLNIPVFVLLIFARAEKIVKSVKNQAKGAH